MSATINYEFVLDLRGTKIRRFSYYNAIREECNKHFLLLWSDDPDPRLRVESPFHGKAEYTVANKGIR